MLTADAVEEHDPVAGPEAAREDLAVVIAAEMTGRVCYALEQSPTFCDVAVKRWEAFTGKTAFRDGALD